MTSPVISVVIPVRDRAAVLERTLAALSRQRRAPLFEAIVVDDGSVNDIGERLAQHDFPFPLRTLRQAPSGPARARNRGVSVSRGDWISFLGSDTAPEPDWLAAIWARASQDVTGNLAVIGRTEWHPDVRSSRFLSYINEYGLQFGFALVNGSESVPFNFFYASNLILHRRWLDEHGGFNERFPGAAWEDIELGYRLTRAGLRLAYLPTARVLHEHHIDLDVFLERQQRAGQSALLFRELHGPLCDFLRLPAAGPPRVPPSSMVRPLEHVARVLQYQPVNLPWLWRFLCRAHYLRGSANGVPRPDSSA